jgi:dTMP kinase
MAGLLITFEGIDFSGKTVQAKLLHQRFTKGGFKALLLRDPGTTRISECIRDILLDRNHLEMSPWTELLLYEAARAQMVEESIKPALAKEMIVLCDRLYDSTTAYQGYGRELDLTLVAHANELGACGVRPDLTFLLDIPPQQALSRRSNSNDQADRLENESKSFHTRVRNGYLKIAEIEADRFMVIDGTRSISDIHDDIWQTVKNKSFNKEI